MIEGGKRQYALLNQLLARKLALYSCAAVGLLRKSGLSLSPRRAATLRRNVAAVHAARLQLDPTSKLGDSALLALTHSLPDRAAGIKVDPFKVRVAHGEASKTAGLDAPEVMTALMLEPNPIRRTLRAAATESLSPAEFSTIVADALAGLPSGARHALAAALFESGAAGRLLTAVAGQCAGLYEQVANPPHLKETVSDGDSSHAAWLRIRWHLPELKTHDALAMHLLVNLFGAGQLGSEEDVDRVLRAWGEARSLVKELTICQNKEPDVM